MQIKDRLPNTVIRPNHHPGQVDIYLQAEGVFSVEEALELVQMLVEAAYESDLRRAQPALHPPEQPRT